MSDLEKKSVLMWVFELYSQGKITISKAAGMVNMYVDEFEGKFNKTELKHVIGPETIEELEEDIAAIKDLLKD